MTSLYYTRIVRAVQVCAHEYLHQVATSESCAGVEVSRFDSLLMELTRGTFPNSTNWMDIPAEYLEPAATMRSPVGTSVPSSSATTALSRRSGQSAVSSLTGRTAMVNTRIVNSAPDAELTALVLRPGGSCQIMREHPPPSNDAGREMCAAWWTRSACYPNCGRAPTHRPFSSPGERARLLAYVCEHLVAPAANSSILSQKSCVLKKIEIVPLQNV